MNILITGGHTGIGLELTKMLLSKGHKVGLVIRSPERKEQTLSALEYSNEPDFFYADLSDQEAVIRLSEEVLNTWEQIDGLYNNAGVLLDGLYYAAQNQEMHYQVNTLTPLLLTQKLASRLSQSKNGFVVNTVTGGMHKQKALQLDELRQPTKFVKLLGSYYQSKLALTLLMTHFARHLTDIRIVNLDPGALKTTMTGDNDGMPMWLKPIRNLFFKNASVGGQRLYDAAFSADFQSGSGLYVSGSKIRSLSYSLTDEQFSLIESDLIKKGDV